MACAHDVHVAILQQKSSVDVISRISTPLILPPLLLLLLLLLSAIFCTIEQIAIGNSSP